MCIQWCTPRIDNVLFRSWLSLNCSSSFSNNIPGIFRGFFLVLRFESRPAFEAEFSSAGAWRYQGYCQPLTIKPDSKENHTWFLQWKNLLIARRSKALFWRYRNSWMELLLNRSASWPAHILLLHDLPLKWRQRCTKTTMWWKSSYVHSRRKWRDVCDRRPIVILIRERLRGRIPIPRWWAFSWSMFAIFSWDNQGGLPVRGSPFF